MAGYTISTNGYVPFWLGDRFYKVEKMVKPFSHSCGEVTFSTKCPACNDVRKVNFVGADGVTRETDCPVCKGIVGCGYGNTLVLKNWVVHEYIVNKAEVSGPHTLSAYKDGEAPIDTVSLRAFCKIGRCVEDYIETNVPSWDCVIDPVPDDIVGHSHFSPSEYVFHRKKDAEKLCELVKAMDKKRLEEFNKTYGTQHEYPF